MVGCRGAASTRPDASRAATIVRETGAVPSVSSGTNPGSPLVIAAEGPGQFVLRATVSLDIATAARIEARSADGRWTAYQNLEQGKGYRLVESCSPSSLPCRSLSPGERLIPVPWSGSICSAQCVAPCSSDEFHPGIHRLVVHNCGDPTKRYEGPPFEMVGSPAMLARWRAASNMRQATIMRLDPRSGAEGAGSHRSDHVAGYRVLPETARPLEPERVTELASWLRVSHGFKDNIARRCARKHMVGVRLLGAAPRGSKGATEIAVDFACNSMIVVAAEGRGRIETVSFFDSSRSELLSIVRRALPLDRELKGLQ
ncbi:hypothetical protein ACFL5O_07335 [Myxococcota bacterium]